VFSFLVVNVISHIYFYVEWYITVIESHEGIELKESVSHYQA